MRFSTISQTIKRAKTLSQHKIYSLPIVILMPHSGCNCRCVMCDIWKDNKNKKELSIGDIQGLLQSLKKLNTQMVVMSGGEALLNPNFFRLCEILKESGLKISLLTTGLGIEKQVQEIITWVDEIIVSLDGDPVHHNRIRNIPDAYKKLESGVKALKAIQSNFPIQARTVIHRLNFESWVETCKSAWEMGLDHISFLPADISSTAFNRPDSWGEDKKEEILIQEMHLPALRNKIEEIISWGQTPRFLNFIIESPKKLREIYQYYAAFYGHNAFPTKKCNAPWVSAVIESDGLIRPCFFMEGVGNIRQGELEAQLNSPKNIGFRKELNTRKHPTCEKCVCSLYLSPLKAFIS